jgi:hypothetical protein
MAAGAQPGNPPTPQRTTRPKISLTIPLFCMDASLSLEKRSASILSQ